MAGMALTAMARRRTLCVAGVALGDMDRDFTWQAWHLCGMTMTRDELHVIDSEVSLFFPGTFCLETCYDMMCIGFAACHECTQDMLVPTEDWLAVVAARIGARGNDLLWLRGELGGLARSDSTTDANYRTG